VRTGKSESFNVKEVSFQEAVDIADEDFGDALDSFDLGAPKASAPTANASKTPMLMADVMSTPGSNKNAAPATSTAPASEPAPARKGGLWSRLFGWLFRSS
jgi:hypothetical protein